MLMTRYGPAVIDAKATYIAMFAQVKGVRTFGVVTIYAVVKFF